MSDTYRFNGPYGSPGMSGPNGYTTKVNGNKGVMKALKLKRRQEAEARNAKTSSEFRREFARSFGYNRNSDRIRNGLEFI